MKVFALTLIVSSMVKIYLTQQVTLSCLAGSEGNRKRAGFPVIRGSKGDLGSKGQKGNKGERGQSDDTTDQIEKIEESISIMQRNISNLIEIVKLLNSKLAKLSENCDDIYDHGYRSSRVYEIFIGGSLLKAFCELEQKGNNWLVFQRRINGEVEFYLNWESYVNGFGNQSGEFWLGLQALHEITSSGSYRLRIDLEDWEGNQAYAEYSLFTIGNRNSNYQLGVSGYSGTAGDSLSNHNGRAFTTKDRDNDGWSSNSAVLNQGAWWYNLYQLSNLNGRYFNEAGRIDASGISWYDWKNSYYSLKQSSMKIRPNN